MSCLFNVPFRYNIPLEIIQKHNFIALHGEQGISKMQAQLIFSFHFLKIKCIKIKGITKLFLLPSAAPKLIPVTAPATKGIPASAVVRMATETAGTATEARAPVTRMMGLEWRGEGDIRRTRNNTTCTRIIVHQWVLSQRSYVFFHSTFDGIAIALHLNWFRQFVCVRKSINNLTTCLLSIVQLTVRN